MRSLLTFLLTVLSLAACNKGPTGFTGAGYSYGNCYGYGSGMSGTCGYGGGTNPNIWSVSQYQGTVNQCVSSIQGNTITSDQAMAYCRCVFNAVSSSWSYSSYTANASSILTLMNSNGNFNNCPSVTGSGSN